jgi:hypothetical protein
MQAHNAIVIEHIHLIITGPGALEPRRLESEHARRQRGPQQGFETNEGPPGGAGATARRKSCEHRPLPQRVSRCCISIAPKSPRAWREVP